MLTKKQGAARCPTTPNPITQSDYTISHATESRGKLKEQLGVLLFHLHSTLTQRQLKMGWQLFEVLLMQFVQGVPDPPESTKSMQGIQI